MLPGPDDVPKVQIPPASLSVPSIYPCNTERTLAKSSGPTYSYGRYKYQEAWGKVRQNVDQYTKR